MLRWVGVAALVAGLGCSGSRDSDTPLADGGVADGGVDAGQSGPDGSVPVADGGLDAGDLPEDSGVGSDEDASVGGAPFTASNVPAEVWANAVSNDLVFSGANCGGNSDGTLNTDNGRISRCSGLMEGTHYRYLTLMQEDGSEIGVIVTRNFRINTGFQLGVEGQLPLVVVALGQAEILGGLNAVANGPRGVAGGFSGRANMRGPGSGPGAGTVGATGGGGGGSYCGVGGATTHGGQGGPAYGNPEVVPLLGGSSGGAGSIWDSGGGGGAVQIVAGVSISVTATGHINVGGGGGGQGGCGGGSGGALLLEAPSVSIAGVLAANGGGGGTGDGAIRGQPGQPSAEPALGGVAASGSSPGGNGSAGSEPDGGEGAPHPTIANNGSGGGGGAGRIRINTMGGEATITGTLSPAPGTGCTTEGSL